VLAGAYVDSTGGGALCKASGCAMMLGRDGRERFGEPSASENPTTLLNGVTLIFRVTPTDEEDIERLPEGIPAMCWWQGHFPPISASRYPNGDYNCNMLPTMEGKECLELGHEKAYAECRRRVLAEWHYIQDDFPEFRRYRLSWVAPALGIRESTRVLGEYVLTEHDLRAGLSGQQHADIVTIADHSVDRHGSSSSAWEMKEPYGVPYRCLIPLGFHNLLIACRGASFSSLAASSCRLSRTMIQLGQAAGIAAAVATDAGVDVAAAPAELLRAALRAEHVQLEWPLSEDLRAYLQDA